MKKIFAYFLSFSKNFIICLSCYLNRPDLCALLLKISLFQPEKFKKKKSKKIIIVLYRSIGQRDVEIINGYKNNDYEFVFLKRVIPKLILNCFSEKNKFINYLKPDVQEKQYLNQNKIDKNNHEKFWTSVILNLKKYFIGKNINFVTFNYSYYAEAALYVGCKNNGIPVKLWHKEGIKNNPKAIEEINTSGVIYGHMFKYFSSISVYNNLMKKIFIKIDKKNKNKISVNGCPRIQDYEIKKKYKKKINTLLFLAFEEKRGIPSWNKNVNWKLSYNRVIKILNDLAKNNQIKNIIIKNKQNLIYKSEDQISDKIKVYNTGTSEKLINQADIIIGHNSTATIEALANGKHVMVPLFEGSKYKKYLFNFQDEVIYTSDKKMKNKILSLVNKKVFFPIKKTNQNKTVKYYLGKSNGIQKRYLNFLNT